MRIAKEALKIAQQVTGYDNLKEYQQQAIEAYLCGKMFSFLRLRERAKALLLNWHRLQSIICEMEATPR